MRRPLFLRAAAILSALCLPFQLVRGQDPTSGFDVFTTPTDNQEIPAGSNFDIIWAPSAPAGKVSIILMQGGSELDQVDGPIIAAGINSASGTYTWSIPSSYGDFASYGFRLEYDPDPKIFQYSYAFRIKRDPNAPPSSKTSPSNRISTGSAGTGTQPTDRPGSLTSSVPQVDSTNPLSGSSLVSSAKPHATSSGTYSRGSDTISPTDAVDSTQSASGVGSSQAESSSTNTSSSLPTAAKIGIAIGGTTALCIIVLLVYIAMLMRWRNKPKRNSVQGIELVGDNKSVDSKEHEISELESTMASEIMSEMRLELDGRGRPEELQGSDAFERVSKGKRQTLGVIHEVHELS